MLDTWHLAYWHNRTSDLAEDIPQVTLNWYTVELLGWGFCWAWSLSPLVLLNMCSSLLLYSCVMYMAWGSLTSFSSHSCLPPHSRQNDQLSIQLQKDNIFELGCCFLLSCANCFKNEETFYTGPANFRPGVWSSGVGIPVADEIPSPAASRCISLGSFLKKNWFSLPQTGMERMGYSGIEAQILA